MLYFLFYTFSLFFLTQYALITTFLFVILNLGAMISKWLSENNLWGLVQVVLPTSGFGDQTPHCQILAGDAIYFSHINSPNLPYNIY